MYGGANWRNLSVRRGCDSRRVHAREEWGHRLGKYCSADPVPEPDPETPNAAVVAVLAPFHLVPEACPLSRKKKKKRQTQTQAYFFARPCSTVPSGSEQLRCRRLTTQVRSTDDAHAWHSTVAMWHPALFSFSSPSHAWPLSRPAISVLTLGCKRENTYLHPWACLLRSLHDRVWILGLSFVLDGIGTKAMAHAGLDLLGRSRGPNLTRQEPATYPRVCTRRCSRCLTPRPTDLHPGELAAGMRYNPGPMPGSGLSRASPLRFCILRKKSGGDGCPERADCDVAALQIVNGQLFPFPALARCQFCPSSRIEPEPSLHQVMHSLSYPLSGGIPNPSGDPAHTITLRCQHHPLALREHWWYDILQGHHGTVRSAGSPRPLPPSRLQPNRHSVAISRNEPTHSAGPCRGGLRDIGSPLA